VSTRVTPGRGYAYLGASLGAVVSVAANVAHSYVPPAGAPAGWRPQPGAVVGTVFWPAALLVAVEILARTIWPARVRWVVLRWLGLIPVAAVAAFVSYRHLSGLLAFYGEDPLTTTLGPLAVDGLMVMATGALVATAPRAGARLSEMVGHGDARTPMAGGSKGGQGGPVQVGVLPTPGGQAPTVATEPEPDLSPAHPARAAHVGTAREGLPAAATARRAGSNGRAGDGRVPGGRPGGRASAGLERVRAARAASPGVSTAELARRLGMPRTTLQRHLAALDTQENPGVGSTPGSAGERLEATDRDLAGAVGGLADQVLGALDAVSDPRPEDERVLIPSGPYVS